MVFGIQGVFRQPDSLEQNTSRALDAGGIQRNVDRKFQARKHHYAVTTSFPPANYRLLGTAAESAPKPLRSASTSRSLTYTELASCMHVLLNSPPKTPWAVRFPCQRTLSTRPMLPLWTELGSDYVTYFILVAMSNRRRQFISLVRCDY